MYQWVATKLKSLEEARLSAEGAEQLLVKSQSSFKLFAICKLLLWKYVQQCIFFIKFSGNKGGFDPRSTFFEILLNVAFNATFKEFQ